jgi:putative NADPH-quinone reductase
MNCIIVFAHPEPASFNGALKTVAVRELEQLGHTDAVSDLYAMGWNSALGPDDFEGERADADHLDLSKEQEHAFTVLPPFAAWMPARVSAEERQALLESFAARLRDLDRTEPLFFHPSSDYDASQRLKPGVVARSGVQWNPRAGQTFEASAFAQQQARSRR